jgi:hypothetical protein
MLIHNGVPGPLHVGDAVYKTDIVETAANSSCGIAFPDGTALDLVNNTRMALNEYNYEANSASNGALFSLVEGTFAFVAGQVSVQSAPGTKAPRRERQFGRYVMHPHGRLTHQSRSLPP